MSEKPICELTGTDGNVFSIIGKVGATLKRAGLKEQADEFYARTLKAGSYDEVLRLAMEYTEVE